MSRYLSAADAAIVDSNFNVRYEELSRLYRVSFDVDSPEPVDYSFIVKKLKARGIKVRRSGGVIELHIGEGVTYAWLTVHLKRGVCTVVLSVQREAEYLLKLCGPLKGICSYPGSVMDGLYYESMVEALSIIVDAYDLSVDLYCCFERRMKGLELG